MPEASADHEIASQIPWKNSNNRNPPRHSPIWGISETPLARMLLLVRGRGVLTDWLWYRDLTHEQRVLYEELLQTDTEIHLSAVDCKQLVKGLMRLGIRTPWQLRDWFDALAEADNDYE
tara:strand:+ start:299 stop:655 length:357 start_codon:yes stop_codon:yes gene_type:complete